MCAFMKGPVRKTPSFHSSNGSMVLGLALNDRVSTCAGVRAACHHPPSPLARRAGKELCSRGDMSGTRRWAILCIIKFGRM